MKDDRQIKPEWVPNAYKDEKPEVRSESGAAKRELTAPLYSGKNAHLKSRVGNTRKRP
jgi:hypothetical protein